MAVYMDPVHVPGLIHGKGTYTHTHTNTHTHTHTHTRAHTHTCISRDKFMAKTPIREPIGGGKVNTDELKKVKQGQFHGKGTCTLADG